MRIFPDALSVNSITYAVRPGMFNDGVVLSVRTPMSQSAAVANLPVGGFEKGGQYLSLLSPGDDPMRSSL